MANIFWFGSGILFGLGVIALANYARPYEVCKRMYNTPEDIGECVWILENP